MTGLPCDQPSLASSGRPQLSRAFTLIELLVVVAIITLLIAILIPSLGRARQQARNTACAANLHQLGLATNVYLDNWDGFFWRYHESAPNGLTWWFGFELNGPGAGTNRPLDKSLSPLAPYTANLANALQCPDFPYDRDGFFPKFNQHAASYGYNIRLGPVTGNTANRSAYLARAADLVVFADGLHFDMNPGFNEAHYLAYTSPPTVPSGYAHYRHNSRAQVTYLDGHVEPLPFSPPAYKTIAGSPAANLPSATLYGF